MFVDMIGEKMIKEIVKDQFILSQKSTKAIQEDLGIIQDLLDTLEEHHSTCIGIAANMIGVLKRIIVVKDGEKNLIMINPEIIKTSKNYYHTEENCLCYEGSHTTKRYESIKIKYKDINFKPKIKTYQGLTAQIIQHEIDHCNGILI